MNWRLKNTRLTRKEAIAKLTAIEEKHNQDGDSFWIHSVKGNEPWLLEIRQGLLRKEKLKNKEYLLPKDLTKELLFLKLRIFKQKVIYVGNTILKNTVI